MWPIQNLNLPSNLPSHSSIVFTPCLRELTHSFPLHRHRSFSSSCSLNPCWDFIVFLLQLDSICGPFMFKKWEHGSHILRSHQTLHVQLCIIITRWAQAPRKQHLRSGRIGEPFSYEPAESVGCLWLTDLTSLQMDSLVLGDTYVLLCLQIPWFAGQYWEKCSSGF